MVASYPKIKEAVSGVQVLTLCDDASTLTSLACLRGVIVILVFILL